MGKSWFSKIISGGAARRPARKVRRPRDASYLLPVSIFLAAIILSSAWIYTTRLRLAAGQAGSSSSAVAEIAAPAEDDFEEKVLPAAGVALPVRWGDLGAQLIKTGVIDQQKFEALYADRGGMGEAEKALLSEGGGQIQITRENSGFLLNLFWALGLGTKNEILDKGPMQDPRYGGADRFASTGGWSLARGGVMEHYSKHPFLTLTAEQQQQVARVSGGIYRPCCDNSTNFPDCNHGMAMLGLLELMASQGASEEQMYKTALQVNAFWFPDTYLTIAQYLKTRGLAWESVGAKELLGADYSSSSGYRKILSQGVVPAQRGGSGCGV